MSELLQVIAIFGGTFDPIHSGHIQAAAALQQQFNFAEIRFIPCKQPVLKPAAQASSKQRVAMLKLAIQDHSNWLVDTRELERKSPSYMVETLHSLTKEYPQRSFCLILGVDAFNDLPRWHQWEELLKLTHIIIINRPGHHLQPNSVLQQVLQQHLTTNSQLLYQIKQGAILQVELPPSIDSSTALRDAIANGDNVMEQLPAEVWAYIIANHIYQ